MNILDWGCGRGLSVLWLRDHGYNAYGIDVDIEPINNGILLFKKKGNDPNILSLLSSEGKTKFQNNYFHFIFSNQVFEHVSNIRKVAQEISRITKKNGIGLHIYPSPKRIIEGHLYMPFVHWLPKNNMRKYLIYTYVLLGKEPHWLEVDNKTIKEKVNYYYLYSKNKTFYRKYSFIENIFKENGFRVSLVTINNSKIKKNKLIIKFLNYKLLKFVLSYLLLTFKSQELLIKKL